MRQIANGRWSAVRQAENGQKERLPGSRPRERGARHSTSTKTVALSARERTRRRDATLRTCCRTRGSLLPTAKPCGGIRDTFLRALLRALLFRRAREFPAST